MLIITLSLKKSWKKIIDSTEVADEENDGSDDNDCAKEIAKNEAICGDDDAWRGAAFFVSVSEMRRKRALILALLEHVLNFIFKDCFILQNIAVAMRKGLLGKTRLVFLQKNVSKPPF